MQLLLSLLTLYWSKKRFSHYIKLRLCTTKEFFLIELIKIYDDLKNENQYICLQLSEINTSTFRGYKFSPRANSKRSSKTELKNI